MLGFICCHFFVSINQPNKLPCNTVVLCFKLHKVQGCLSWVVSPTLAAFHEPLTHVPNEILFYWYDFKRCLSEMVELVFLILVGDLLVILIVCLLFFVTFSRYYKLVYIKSISVHTARLMSCQLL